MCVSAVVRMCQPSVLAAHESLGFRYYLEDHRTSGYTLGAAIVKGAKHADHFYQAANRAALDVSFAAKGGSRSCISSYHLDSERS